MTPRLRAVSAYAPGHVARASRTWQLRRVGDCGLDPVSRTTSSSPLLDHLYQLLCRLPVEDGRNCASKPTDWRPRYATIRPPGFPFIWLTRHTDWGPLSHILPIRLHCKPIHETYRRRTTHRITAPRDTRKGTSAPPPVRQTPANCFSREKPSLHSLPASSIQNPRTPPPPSNKTISPATAKS